MENPINPIREPKFIKALPKSSLMNSHHFLGFKYDTAVKKAFLKTLESGGRKGKTEDIITFSSEFP